MPQIKVNFGPKVGGAKKTFPPEKKAPAGLGSKPGKVNPFLKNDAAKKAPAATTPAAEKPAPKEVTVDIASKPEIKVELPAAAPAPEPAAPAAEPEAPASEPEKPAGSKSSFVIYISTLFFYREWSS